MAWPKGAGKAIGSGRKKGSRNKRTVLLEKKAKEGITPLDFLLKVMRNAKYPLPERLDAAKTAAPYLHSKKPPEINPEVHAPVPPYEHPPLNLAKNPDTDEAEIIKPETPEPEKTVH